MGIGLNYEFDREDFLLKIIRQFNTKGDDNSIELVYTQLLDFIEKSASEYSPTDIAEKKRLLKECLDRFKKEEYRRKVKGQSPIKIAQDLNEEILGIFKRKYDMSDKFSEGLIADKRESSGMRVKKVAVIPLDVKEETESVPFIDDKSGYTIQQTGTLIYNDGIDWIDNIKKYRIIMPKKHGIAKEVDVFTSQINFNLLAIDESYYQAVFSELLSKNNIEHSNAGGYIGEVMPSRKMAVGEEKEDSSGFYRYQVTEGHALIYDPIVVTAGKIIEKREQSKKQEEQQEQ